MLVVIVVISEVVLSRPLFHVLVAKSLATSVRLIIRRSVSLVIMLVDTILDEAVTSFESSLVAPPYMMPDESTQGSNSSSHPFWQPGFFDYLAASLFVCHDRCPIRTTMELYDKTT